MSIKARISTLCTLFAVCGLALSAEAADVTATTNLTITVGESIVLGVPNGAFTNYVTRTGSGGVDKSYANGDVLGSTKADTVMTLALNNPTNGDYVLTWKAGMAMGTVNYSVWVSQDDGIVCSNDYTVSFTENDWTPRKTERMTLLDLPSGDFTVTLKIVSTTGSYAGNYGYFQFLNAHGDSFLQVPVENANIESAKDKSVTIANCRCSGTQINYTFTSTAVKMNVLNDKKGNVTFSYKYSEQTFNSKMSVVVSNEANQVVYAATNTLNCTGDWNTYVAVTNELGLLPPGVYTVNMFFSEATTETSDYYVANLDNFTITREDYVEIYYTVTVPTVAHTSTEVTGATQTETTEAATIYSAASNATVTVIYTPDAHYTLSGEATTTITGIAADATITAPTATEDAIWSEGVVSTNDANEVYIAPDEKSTGKLVINDGDYTTQGYLAIAYGKNSTGKLEVNGGTYSVNGSIYMGRHASNGGSGSVSYLVISNGTVSATGYCSGYDTPSTSYIDISGTGVLNISGEMVLAYGGGTTNFLTISGSGALTANSLKLGNWGNKGTVLSGAIVTLNSGSVAIGGEVYFRDKNRGGDADFFGQEIRVKGGVFTMGKMYSNGEKGPYDKFILEGGTLRANASETAFIADRYNGSARMLQAYLTSGTIDTQTYDVTIPAAIQTLNFTKTGTGTLTFTGMLPDTGTITVAMNGGSVVVTGDKTSWAGVNTGAAYDSEANTTTFAYYQEKITIAVPTIANADLAVTTNDVAVTAGADGKYVVEHGATVVVTYTAQTGYTLKGTTSLTLSEVTLDVSLAKIDTEAVATGATAYTIAANEVLDYTGRVTKGNMDTALGIIITSGGKLKVTLDLPGCDGTRYNDGTTTLPKLTLPTGVALVDCVTVVPPTGYMVTLDVAADGFGYFVYDPIATTSETIENVTLPEGQSVKYFRNGSGAVCAVQRVTPTQTNAMCIIAVPFQGEGESGKITVGSLVRTSTLKENDELYAIPEGRSNYEGWYLDANSVWQRMANVTADGASNGSAADSTYVQQGSSFWLKTASTSFEMAGEVGTVPQTQTIAASSSTMVGNPKLAPFDLNATGAITGAATNDLVILPNGNSPNIYRNVGGVWKYMTYTNGKASWASNAIPAGVGFWYKSSGTTNPTINWTK